MLGIALTAPVARRVETAAGTEGSSSTRSLRTSSLVPPLVLTDTQVDAFLAALPDVLDAATSHGWHAEGTPDMTQLRTTTRHSCATTT
jgi:acetylornithine aminotransferase